MPNAIETKRPHNFQMSLRALADFSVVAICSSALAFTLIGFILSMASGRFVGARDFVVFWATGQQLVQRANPYDRIALMRIERSAGLGVVDDAGYMRNPPSALLLVYPLGFLNLRLASVLWSISLLASLGISVRLLWHINGRQRTRRHWLGYTFGPAYVCLIMGQTSLFALLGLSLFLRFHRERPFLAGVSLWLCALKPHLFLPFGVVLLAWILVSRSYAILIGSVVAVTASSLVAFVNNPSVWMQYGKMMRSSGIEWQFIPCASALFRNWIDERAIWLQYIPAAAGCICTLIYFWARRSTWDWNRNGSPVMLVSLLVAPYSWIYDACVAIPALLYGAYTTRSRSVLMGLALLSASIEFTLLAGAWKSAAIFRWTLWSAPAWLGWYLIASRAYGRVSNNMGHLVLEENSIQTRALGK